MKPYYQDAFATIYHGDARELLPSVADGAVAVITDPVWPNALATLAGADDPAGLMAAVIARLPTTVRRLIVQIGCLSDPRFLSVVPMSLPFFRACYLEYAVPGYSGRALMTGDVVYAFGEPPARAVIDASVVPGRCVSSAPTPRDKHPCPRSIAHVRWLMRWFSGDGLVLDPFAGSGTTLLAAKDRRVPCVGIEIEERFCELAARRLSQEVLPLGA